MSRIAVLGTGYVGLVTGACLADFGHRVVCADVDQSKIDGLKREELPFYEPGLAELVERNREDRRLQFSSDLDRVVHQAQVIFVCVGTPAKKDGSADLSAIFEAGRRIARNHGRGFQLVVQKSTAPVGTARRLGEVIRKHAPEAQIEVASNPEFLREGSAIETFMRPDRVVIGVESPRAEKVLREIYRALYLIETPMVVTGLESAEMIKYAANCFLATKISFINEMADLCEAFGADVQKVAKGMGLDGRIGRKFLHAGPGYGGSCFPKDTAALVDFAKRAGERARIVAAAAEVNRSRRDRMIAKISAAAGGLRGKRIALLGLTFKPNTDDLRESPALAIAEGLTRKGAHVVAHDPVAMDRTARLPIGRRIEFALDAYSACEGADAVVLVTEWNQYRRLDLKRVAEHLRRPVLVDLRNVYEPEDAVKAGLDYHGVGRPARTAAAGGAARKRGRRAAGSKRAAADKPARGGTRKAVKKAPSTKKKPARRGGSRATGKAAAGGWKRPAKPRLAPPRPGRKKAAAKRTAAQRAAGRGRRRGGR